MAPDKPGVVAPVAFGEVPVPGRLVHFTVAVLPNALHLLHDIVAWKITVTLPPGGMLATLTVVPVTTGADAPPALVAEATLRFVRHGCSASVMTASNAVTPDVFVTV